MLSLLQPIQEEQHHKHCGCFCPKSLTDSTCNVIFIEIAYALICKSILLGLKYFGNFIHSGGLQPVSKPVNALDCPRLLTMGQSLNDRLHDLSQDLENTTFQIGKCIKLSCKQLRKPNCTNVSCKPHSVQFRFLHHNHQRDFPTVDQLSGMCSRQNVLPHKSNCNCRSSQTSRWNPEARSPAPATFQRPRAVDVKWQSPHWAKERALVRDGLLAWWHRLLISNIFSILTSPGSTQPLLIQESFLQYWTFQTTRRLSWLCLVVVQLPTIPIADSNSSWSRKRLWKNCHFWNVAFSKSQQYSSKPSLNRYSSGRKYLERRWH